MLTKDQITDLKKRLTSSSDFDKTFRAHGDYEFLSIKDSELQEAEQNGWERIKKGRVKKGSKVRIQKPKKDEERFENRVWRLLANLGYKQLNIDRNWELPFGSNPVDKHQIDVFAKDDDSALLVECKCAKATGTQTSFKDTLDAYDRAMKGFPAAIRDLFPDETLKIKFIFAIKNYVMGEADRARLEQFGGRLFEEETIAYFETLKKEEGPAAVYQFKGFLFHGEELPFPKTDIPAIRGKMGEQTYYAFSAKPSTLLRFCYVLHRNKANAEIQSSYQRIVQGSRLKKIRAYLDNETRTGYFPNSILLNLEDECAFDALSGKEEFETEVGILTLPNRYKSAYIIDGQHRLLGYAGTNAADTSAIPVIAFAKLDWKEQLRLFVDINEKQKTISKGLLNTLNADFLRSSDKLEDKAKAIRLQTCENLANKPGSPLFNALSSGEDKRPFTSNYIALGLEHEAFLGTIHRGMSTNAGFFSGDFDIDACSARLYEFVSRCIGQLVESISETETISTIPSNVILTNRGLYAFVRILGDFLKEIERTDGLASLTWKPASLAKGCEPYIASLANAIVALPDDQRAELKKYYGGGAEIRYYRTFERFVHESIPEFNPLGLDEYWERNSKVVLDEALAILSKLEQSIRTNVRDALSAISPTDWFDKLLPSSLKKRCWNQKADAPEPEPEEDPKEPWDFVGFSDFPAILAFNRMRPAFVDGLNFGPTRTNYESKLEIVKTIDRIRTELDRKGISKQDLEYLKQFHEEMNHA